MAILFKRHRRPKQIFRNEAKGSEIGQRRDRPTRARTNDGAETTKIVSGPEIKIPRRDFRREKKAKQSEITQRR